ncbi:MAG: response regulator [Candidatus Omnitrophica bacterium]|nr:response regulator [Candidatus Omnitrophota bacterium]
MESSNIRNMEKTILVADDEPDHLLMVEALLTERGYTVVLASTGREAVEEAVQSRPNLILLDILMPEMDGTEVATVLKSDPETQAIPIIFLTAVIVPEERRRVRNNATLVLAKPVKFNELLEAIEELS